MVNGAVVVNVLIVENGTTARFVIVEARVRVPTVSFSSVSVYCFVFVPTVYETTPTGTVTVSDVFDGEKRLSNVFDESAALETVKEDEPLT